MAKYALMRRANQASKGRTIAELWPQSTAGANERAVDPGKIGGTGGIEHPYDSED